MPDRTMTCHRGKAASGSPSQRTLEGSDCSRVFKVQEACEVLRGMIKDKPARWVYAINLRCSGRTVSPVGIRPLGVSAGLRQFSSLRNNPSLSFVRLGWARLGDGECQKQAGRA